MRSTTGMRLLHYAAQFNAMKIVPFLIDKEVDMNAVDDKLETALHKAARSKAFSVYRLLVSKGVDPTRRNQLGESARELLYDDNQLG